MLLITKHLHKERDGSCRLWIYNHNQWPRGEDRNIVFSTTARCLRGYRFWHTVKLYICQNVPAFSTFLHLFFQKSLTSLNAPKNIRIFVAKTGIETGYKCIGWSYDNKNVCTNFQFCASFQSTLRPVSTKKTEGTNLCFRWKNMRFTMSWNSIVKPMQNSLYISNFQTSGSNLWQYTKLLQC